MHHGYVVVERRRNGSCVLLVEAVGVRSEDCMRQNNSSEIRNKAHTKVHVVEWQRIKDYQRTKQLIIFQRINSDIEVRDSVCELCKDQG